MKKFLVSLSFLVLFSMSAKAQNYKTHKVKVGETIESIAKIYMVTPFDIYALNPDAKNSLHPNMVLVIPESKVLEKPVETQVTKLVGYKTHKVKRKETLYSIGKIYNVTVDDLKKHNNRLYSENLRRGDRINIPKYDKVSATTTLENTLKTYQVQPKEGKWRIAYKFGITVDELEKLNPKMADTLQDGQEINVPNIAFNEVKTIDEEYGYYTVVPREGFFALKRKLGLTQEEIEVLNPELRESGLKSGMIIKVPKDVSDNSSSGDVTRSVLIDKIINYETKKLAVMLPFMLDRVDMDSIQEVKEMLRGDDITNISLDFHTGVLMALDSAKQLGISTKLDVYDTKARASVVTDLINRKDFSKYDAVIGPFISDEFDRAAAMLRRDNVPILSPVNEANNLYDNVFQTMPSNELKRKRIVEFVKQLDSIPSRILIISDQNHRKENNLLKQEFPEAKQIFSRVDEETGKDMFYILTDDIEKEFKEGLNMVFLESNNEGFVSNVTSMLSGFIGFDEELEIEREVVLLTSDKSRAFDGENVSNITLSKLNFHYPSPNRPINEEQPDTFVKAYQNKYYITPNRYAIRGFDLTMDVLLRLASANNLYDASSNDIETEYVENKFRYGKKMFGGYYNETMYIVKFDNLRIVEVKQ